MQWRARLHVLHRDVGFLCLGMTLVYAVSGVAVNHREHWDYNVRTEIVRTSVADAPTLLGATPPDGDLLRWADGHRAALVDRLVSLSGRSAPPRAVFWRGDRLSLFFGPGETDVLDYWPASGELEHTEQRDRPLLRQLNFLHLNEPHGGWTWAADLYAVALLFLAISGVLMVRGRRGLRGRGGVLLLAGVSVPLLGYLLLR